MHIASRLQQIKPSATLAVSTMALNLKSQGRKILNLSVGEPDFPTPAHVCAAAQEAIRQGFTHYTQVSGIPELREAVAGYFQREYGVAAEAESTIITNGGKQGLYNLFQSLLEPEDEVLIPAPYWVSYPAMVQLAGGVPVPVPTQAEHGFKVTVDNLATATTLRTRCLILNSPSNPTGNHYTQAELEALAEYAIFKNIFVISDEIYDQLVFPPATPASLAPFWVRHPQMVAVVNGLSKSFAMTGWRVGYVLTHPDLVKALDKIQGQSTSNICSIAQKAALTALTGPMEPIIAMRKAFARRRDLVIDILNTWRGVVCPRPDGAFYVFPTMDHLYTATFPDSTNLCIRLLEEAGVALVPGAAFGEDRCIRISYALSEETLIQGLDKIAATMGLNS
ncbi:Aspartate/prephenate aminotransferase [Desulfovibrionales bacterium]